MRIERIVIENLTSLRGRFEIDLTDRAYASGLFAIVGPSGAGKTTVLDAICLALYGKTPRIDSISETKDELMSKGASACRAEVVFTVRGRRYKSVFMHERSSRGAKPFRAVRRELLEEGADGWHVVAARIREVDEQIRAICGLDFGRFTRSIMLAQFRFAEFLQASSNERAEILEKITDMDIYRRISVIVYERAKQYRELLTQTRMRIEEISELSPAEETALQDELQRLGDAVTAHGELKNALSQCRTKAERLSQLQDDMRRYTDGHVPLKEKYKACAAALERAQEQEKAQTKKLDGLLDTLKTVRALDQSIKTQKEMIARIEGEIKVAKNRINGHKKDILNLFKKYEPNATDERFRQLYESDEIGAQLRAGAQAALDAARAQADSLRAQLRQVLDGKDEAYWRERLGVFRQALSVCQARDAIEKAQTELAALTQQKAELAAQAKALESRAKEAEDRLTYARLEQRFGEERRNLKDGQPCPLCGALEHPKAHEPVEIGYLKQAEQAYQTVRAQRDELQKRMTENGLRLESTQKLILEKEALIAEHADALEALDGDVRTDAVSRRIDDAEKRLDDAATLRTQLGQAADEVTAQTARFGSVDKDAEAVHSHRRAIAEQETIVADKEREREKAVQQRDRLVGKRRDLLGDEDADKAEQKGRDALDDAQKELIKRRDEAEQAARALEQNKTDLKRTAREIEKVTGELDAAYTRATQDAAAVHSVSDDDDLTALFGQFADAAAALGEVPDEAALLRAEHALERLVRGESAHMGTVRQIIKANEEKKQTIRALKKDEKRHRKDYEKWERLNALIGSATGDKFTRQAQSITFDVLLRHANRILTRMSNRYILLRDGAGPAKPLELAVIDLEQAGQKRPVANLSGGESFIVSLALALGLSEMSSGAARIDSLFIDEGFASLDEDYMESALQTLSALGNREGKLVGVISHVEALKNRIDVQIEVSPRSGGCASLSGPGVVTG